MDKDDWILKAAHGLVRLFLIVNIALVLGFVVAFVLSFVCAGRIEALLIAKYGATLNVAGVLLALRLMMLGTLPAGAALHAVFANLLRILATVREGDPFTAANAERLSMIGWALLVLQLFDLLFGAFAAWFAALHVQFSGWSPALGGWVAVAMVFVLARVFRHGAAMRDDLGMTV